METYEVKIAVPEGYEIDKENSTFECIKFKPILKKFVGSGAVVRGYYIDADSNILKAIATEGEKRHQNVFASEKLAKRALAMAQISLIMANDKRFGGVVTDEEWSLTDVIKFTIERGVHNVVRTQCTSAYSFIAFHTYEQRDLFLEENKNLVKQYLMIE